MKHLCKIIVQGLGMVALSANMALPHEFWIEPKKFQVDNGGRIVADLRNGESFAGIDLAYYPVRISRLEQRADRPVPIPGRVGDLPAIDTPAAADDALVTLVYESRQSTVTYHDWDKFRSFVSHKDMDWALSAHAERALPETGFTEVYSRYCKALVGVGRPAGADTATGMETEFVALANPFVLERGHLPVQLLYQNVPRTDAQIEVFDRSADGTVTVTTLRTDADGRAEIPVASGHTYLLDAVVMREPAPGRARKHDAVWETLWASMVFAIP